MKKLSHSFAKVSHSYKKGVALVGMRHLKTAFINILYFCSYCFFNHALLAFLACVGFKDNRDNRDNLQFCPSWRDFYIFDNSVLVCFFTPLADASLQVTTLISLPTHLLCSVGWCCLYCKHLRLHNLVQFELDYRHKCLECLHSAQLSLVCCIFS